MICSMGPYYKLEVIEVCCHGIKLDIDEIDRINKILGQVIFLHNFFYEKLEEELIFSSTASIFDKNKNGL